MSVHVVPVRTYAAVYAALLLFTGLTVAAAFLDLGPMNTVAALAIATTKALLVAWFFMNLKYGSRLIRLAALGGIYWWLILLTITLSDYFTRSWRTYG
jgi:cytochrome c oxidase subunit 4